MCFLNFGKNLSINNKKSYMQVEREEDESHDPFWRSRAKQKINDSK